VTALQMVRGVRGRRQRRHARQPRIVSATFDAEGHEIRRFGRRGPSGDLAENARLLTRILVRAVESGTGTTRRSPIRGRGQDGNGAEARSGTRRYSRARACVVRRFGRPRTSRARHARHASTSRERAVGSEAAAPVSARSAATILRYLECRRATPRPCRSSPGRWPDSLAPVVTAPVRLVSTDVTPTQREPRHAGRHGSANAAECPGRARAASSRGGDPGQGRVVRQGPGRGSAPGPASPLDSLSRPGADGSASRARPTREASD